MELFFVRSWKPLAARGAIGILFGIVALLWPSVTLAGLVLLFGGYALVDGVLALTAAMHPRGRERVWALVFEGLVGIGIGLAAFLWTGATAVVLVRLIASWAILTGLLELLVARWLRREVPGELLLSVAGGVSLLLGFSMLVWPTASAFVIVVLLGCYAFFFGASMLALALQLRRFPSRWERTHRWV